MKVTGKSNLTKALLSIRGSNATKLAAARSGLRTRARTRAVFLLSTGQKNTSVRIMYAQEHITVLYIS